MRAVRISAAVSALVVLVACSESGNATVQTTVPTTVAPTTTIAPDDGVLRIGALLPLTGPGADLGRSMADAVELAVAQVNAAGGVNGNDVGLVVADEGDGPVSATRGLEELLDADVDAIVGPASSIVALELLTAIRRAGVVACSPSATALGLDGFPDGGLFFRTVPSDSLQAEALARAIDETGRRSVAIVHVDDAYGRPLAAQLNDQLARRAVTVVDRIPYRIDDPDFADEIDAAVSSEAEVIAVIGEQAAGARIVAGVLESSSDESVPIVVNDALRGASTGAALAQLRDVALDRVIGVGVRATTSDPDFTEALTEMFPATTGVFAPYAAECVDVIALAAVSAESTRSAEIAVRMNSVSTGGRPCPTFAECRLALESNQNANYDGPSGALNLSGSGDVTRGTYDVFGFDADGRERLISALVVTSDSAGIEL